MPFLFIFGFIAAIAVFFGKQQQQRRNNTWMRAAEGLGMRFQPGGTFGYPSISGSETGIRVLVDVARKSGNNNNAVRTRYRVLYPSLDIGLKLQPENFVTKIGRFFGGQDLEIGDAEFDTSFIVKGRDTATISEFLTPSRKLTLLRLAAAFPTVTVDDSGIYLDANGASQSAETIVSIVRRLLSAAHILVVSDEALNESLRMQSLGNVAGAVEQLRSAARPDPDDVERPIYEMTALHAAGDDVAAREVLDGLEVLMPDDPEVIGWRSRLSATDQASTPTAAGSPSASSLEPRTSPPPDADHRSAEWDADAVAVATELFGSRRMSYETDEVFATNYRGKVVGWSGRVSRTTPYQYDYDFGEGPGIKAVITIASIDNDLYGQTSIDAIVQFPPSAEPALVRGADIEFTGTLSKVDGMMRNVYIGDAALAG